MPIIPRMARKTRRASILALHHRLHRLALFPLRSLSLAPFALVCNSFLTVRRIPLAPVIRVRPAKCLVARSDSFAVRRSVLPIIFSKVDASFLAVCPALRSVLLALRLCPFARPDFSPFRLCHSRILAVIRSLFVWEYLRQFAAHCALDVRRPMPAMERRFP